MKNKTKIFLDTDIGDDIDDALALALILSSPEFELTGISTVCGNTHARTEIALAMLKVAGIANIPVATGTPGAISPNPKMFTGALKHYIDNDPKPGYHCIAKLAKELPAPDKRHGIELLIDTIMESDGDITIIGIGPLTNIAMAIVKEPRIIEKIPRIAFMGGEFRRNLSEHNIRCDIVAASIVCNSGIPLTILPSYIGVQCAYKKVENKFFENAKYPLGQFLQKIIEQFFKGWGKTITPFDPLVLLTITNPELFTWKQGRVSVETKDELTQGYTLFEEDKDGKHSIIWEVNRNEAINIMNNTIMNNK